MGTQRLVSFCESFTLWGRLHLDMDDSASEALGMLSCKECMFSLLNSDDYDSSETLVSNLGGCFFGSAGLENSLFLNSLQSSLA